MGAGTLTDDPVIAKLIADGEAARTELVMWLEETAEGRAELNAAIERFAAEAPAVLAEVQAEFRLCACGASLEGKRADAIYCGDTCRQRACRARRRTEKSAICGQDASEALDGPAGRAEARTELPTPSVPGPVSLSRLRRPRKNEAINAAARAGLRGVRSAPGPKKRERSRARSRSRGAEADNEAS